MEKKKLIVLLLVCVVVFAGALGLSTLYEKEPAPEEEELVHGESVLSRVAICIVANDSDLGLFFSLS